MKRSIAFFLVAGALLYTLEGKTYEVNTHEKISEVAAKNSILSSDTSVLKSLGLPPSIEDNSNPFPNSEGKPKNILNLIKDGARFEDNNIRPLFHFFDPLNDEGLLFFTSPTWALEDKGKIHLLQNYSFADARNHLYKALTLSDDNERKKYFGKTFESLGRVIHHIQDMAQPQHVRLDTHLNLNWTDEELPIERRSRYEIYTEDKATGRIPGGLPYDGYPSVTFNTARKFWHTETRKPTTGQGLAEFTNTNFVSTGTNFDTDRYPSPVPLLGPSDGIPIRDLLQEDGTCPRIDPPPPPCRIECGDDIPDEPPPPPANLPPACNLQGQVVFIATNVQDRYAGTSVQNNRASTLSVFDQDLKQYNVTDATGQPRSAFTLNRFNFRAAYPHLIPKAVAYSAGLIDYFFRGRIEAQLASYTATGISLQIKNVIDIKKYPEYANEEFTRGAKLIVAYEYKRPTASAPGGFRTEVGSSDPVGLTENIKPGKTSLSDYSFTLPDIPSDAMEVKYFLVYRGKLGNEDDAVVAGAFFPVSGFTARPDYIPADGKTETRMIYKRDGWKLADKDGFAAGNIDWKGLYVNGKPTRVLSWMGPSSRSFGDGFLKDSVFKTKIYQDGEVFSVAPLPVLGAAVTKDGTGKEWIIAICKEGLADVVYRRPNIKSESAALYDSVQVPEGWQVVERFSHDPEQFNEADIPWFFNADGTEAQTMRKGFVSTRTSNLWLHRLRISVTIGAASLTNEGNGPGRVNTGVEVVSCSDGDRSYTSSGGSSGSYVVAVDYQGNTPVFARIAVSGTGQYVDRIIESGRFVSSSGEFNMTLTFPSGSIVLEQHAGTQDAATTPMSARFTWNGEVTYVHYLDLRHGLVATYRRYVSQQSTGQPYRNDFGIGTAIQVITQIKQDVLKGAQKFTVNELNFQENSLELVMGYDPILGGKPCGYRYESSAKPKAEIIDPIQGYGYWAVDSEDNLFVSQRALSRDMRYTMEKTFNYLTGGNLSQIIPPGPGTARGYGDIGVIK